MTVIPYAGFEAALQLDPPTPLVVSVPHAGVTVTPLDGPLAGTFDVRCDADLFVDELYDGAAAYGAFIRARLSRFVCDLNRHPDDVSARAVPQHPAPGNGDGRGFIWEVTTTGAPTLSRALTLPEWEARREVHAAYHGAIAAALDRAQAKFGFALLVDGHSMPSVGRSGHSDEGSPRADIVPGDRSGTSCHPAISRLLGGHFKGEGLSVAFNDPYKGGFITAHHGRPTEGRHAIQIEMRRDLYMNEESFTRMPDKMEAMRGVLSRLLDRLASWRPE